MRTSGFAEYFLGIPWLYQTCTYATEYLEVAFNFCNALKIIIYFKNGKIGCLKDFSGLIFSSSLYVLNSVGNCLASGYTETAHLFPEKHQLNCHRSISYGICWSLVSKALEQMPEGSLKQPLMGPPTLNTHTLLQLKLSALPEARERNSTSTS